MQGAESLIFYGPTPVPAVPRLGSFVEPRLATLKRADHPDFIKIRRLV